MVGGVAEGEDPAVASHEPVAVARGGGGHADDRLVERDVSGGAVVGGVAVGEDPAVLADHPVALARRCRGHADDRLGESDVAGRAVVPGVAVREDPAIARDEPVAEPGRGGRAADHLFVERGLNLGGVQGARTDHPPERGQQLVVLGDERCVAPLRVGACDRAEHCGGGVDEAFAELVVASDGSEIDGGGAEDLTHLSGGEPGDRSANQRCDSGDVRRSHRRAAGVRVQLVTATVQAVDPAAWSRDVDPRPEVGEIRPRVCGRGRRDRDDVVDRCGESDRVVEVA